MCRPATLLAGPSRSSALPCTFSRSPPCSMRGGSSSAACRLESPSWPETSHPRQLRGACGGRTSLFRVRARVWADVLLSRRAREAANPPSPPPTPPLPTTTTTHQPSPWQAADAAYTQKRRILTVALATILLIEAVFGIFPPLVPPPPPLSGRHGDCSRGAPHGCCCRCRWCSSTAFTSTATRWTPRHAPDAPSPLSLPFPPQHHTPPYHAVSPLRHRPRAPPRSSLGCKTPCSPPRGCWCLPCSLAPPSPPLPSYSLSPPPSSLLTVHLHLLPSQVLQYSAHKLREAAQGDRRSISLETKGSFEPEGAGDLSAALRKQLVSLITEGACRSAWEAGREKWVSAGGRSAPHDARTDLS